MKNNLNTELENVEVEKSKREDLIKEVMRVAKEKGVKELTFGKDDVFNTTVFNPSFPAAIGIYIPRIDFSGEIAIADCMCPGVDDKVHRWEINIFSVNRLKSLLEILKAK